MIKDFTLMIVKYIEKLALVGIYLHDTGTSYQVERTSKLTTKNDTWNYQRIEADLISGK